MWNEENHKLLTAVLDQLIPASNDGRIPGAGALGIGKFIKDDTEINNAHLPLLGRGLNRLTQLSAERGKAFGLLPSGEQIGLLTQIESEDREFFQTLVRLTYMGYYSRADIRALLNLSEKPVHPEGYFVEPEPAEQMSELTRPVIERGSCYRAV